MTHAATRPEPRLLRLYLGLFALLALTMLLATGWLRFLVPSRHETRVRDVSWVRSSTLLR
ncbi:MAG TPA: hypothetical protein VF400_06735 [Anaeromyxobacteraceae bacterium]